MKFRSDFRISVYAVEHQRKYAADAEIKAGHEFFLNIGRV